MADERATVLVVDDDAACRDLHEAWLTDEYHVLTAADGTAALADVHRADVVLLDRQMPRMDGEAFLRTVRNRGEDCFVVMLSGVEPDFDVVDVPVDEYLTKPVDRETILDVVETMLARGVCQRLLQEYFSLAARKRLLEESKRPVERERSEEYRRLTAQLAAKRVAVDEMVAELDAEFGAAVRATIETDDGVAGVEART